jgi:hypothetical protein
MLGVVGGVRSNAAPIPIPIVRRVFWERWHSSYRVATSLAALSIGARPDAIRSTESAPNFGF